VASASRHWRTRSVLKLARQVGQGNAPAETEREREETAGCRDHSERPTSEKQQTRIAW
jgi:hypothetical protein